MKALCVFWYSKIYKQVILKIYNSKVCNTTIQIFYLFLDLPTKWETLLYLIDSPILTQYASVIKFFKAVLAVKL